MKRHMYHWPVLASVVALVVATSSARADSTAPAALTGPQVGTPAPAFSLRTLDGTSVTLDSYRGQTLVVNVWATWCPPCRQEMPDLIGIAPQLKKDGVALLGVDSTEDAPIVRAYVAAKNVPYPQAIDADKSFAKAYDVQYFPTTYVIDPNGVLRARYIDIIAPAQLDALVVAAKAGRNGEIVSALQKKIDATLSDPSIVFNGTPEELEANAKKAGDAIRAAEKFLDDSDAPKGNATDLLRTRAEEAVLRDKAIAALVGVGTSVHDTALLPRLRGDAALDREQWQDALDAYAATLATDPKDEDALSGTALAAARLGNYDLAVATDSKLIALDPSDVGAIVDLARAQAKDGKNDDAYATFGKAIGVAEAALEAQPTDAKALRMLAYAHLYAGRVYAKNGDVPRARSEFQEMLAWSEKLPPTDNRHDMYLEEGQEALVALGLDASAQGATISLAPWTGAELPGSLASTIKYRLVVTGTPGKQVALKTADVPKGWVASFCSDRICAPFKVGITIPESGVKIVEFQLVPPTATARAPAVRVIGSDGRSESTATTLPT